MHTRIQSTRDRQRWSGGPLFPPLLGKYQEDKQDINSPNPRSPTPTFYLATLLWSIAAVDLIMCHLYKVLYLNCSNSPWKESWLCGVQDCLIFVLAVFAILTKWSSLGWLVINGVGGRRLRISLLPPTFVGPVQPFLSSLDAHFGYSIYHSL